MKRPQHMTMKELTQLPVLGDGDRGLLDSVPSHVSLGYVYGGAFEDDQGFAWGTVLQPSGWVRYPLHRPTPTRRAIVRPALMALFSGTRRTSLRLSA